MNQNKLIAASPLKDWRFLKQEINNVLSPLQVLNCVGNDALKLLDVLYEPLNNLCLLFILYARTKLAPAKEVQVLYKEMSELKDDVLQCIATHTDDGHRQWVLAFYRPLLSVFSEADGALFDVLKNDPQFLGKSPAQLQQFRDTLLPHHKLTVSHPLKKALACLTRECVMMDLLPLSNAAGTPLTVVETSKSACSVSYNNLIIDKSVKVKPQQDRSSMFYEKDMQVFGIYDGHSGDEASQFLRDNLPKALIEKKESLLQLFHQTPVDLKAVTLKLSTVLKGLELQYKKEEVYAGSTLGCVIRIGTHVIVFGEGDSRVIGVGRFGAVDRLTLDHEPLHPSEFQRLKNANATIFSQISLVTESFNGKTPVFELDTRVMFSDAGDHSNFSQAFGKNNPVIYDHQPYVSTYKLSAFKAKYPVVILASDGIWGVMSDEDVATLYFEQKTLRKSNEGIAKIIIAEAVSRGIEDNITLQIVDMAGLT